MNDYIAYCGLDCETCEARLATVDNNDELFHASADIRNSSSWIFRNSDMFSRDSCGCLGRSYYKDRRKKVPVTIAIVTGTFFHVIISCIVV